ncbi:MAG TPA: TolC family protein, partial [Pyrinomonadaceae bacterium]|nr:TolC family protein [Pyrinomonadaceae bacterium]
QTGADASAAAPATTPTPAADTASAAAPLPATPPSVAASYEAPARPLPAVERVGVEVGEAQPLSLDEAVRLALENNNDIDATRIGVEMAEHDLTAARGAYDLRFTSESYFERSTTPVASFLGGGRDGSVKTTDASGRAGFEGLAPWAGGSFRFDFSTRRLSTNNFFYDINPTVSTGFNFSYTQPLWRGRKTDDTRRRIEIARKNLSLTDAQFRRRATEVITNVEQAYWELAYALRNLQIQIEAVKQARAQTESNRRQVERGVLAPVEVVESDAQVRTFEQNVYLAQETIARAENNLKTMMLADRSDALWSKALVPVTPVDLEAPRVALGPAMAAALENRLELTELGVASDINRIDKRYYRDQTKPQIDLTASYSSNGLAGSLRDEANPLVSGLVSLQDRVNQLSTLAGLPALQTASLGTPQSDLVGGYGRSLTNLLSQNNPTVRVGVRVSLPFRNRTARANLARSLAEERRIENSRAQAEQLIESEVRNALQALRSNEARLQAAAAAREAADQQYTSERRKFQAGASTVYMVLQRQTDLVAARGRELQAQTDLNKSIADFRRATGDTLRSRNVVVSTDGPARKAGRPMNDGGER